MTPRARWLLGVIAATLVAGGTVVAMAADGSARGGRASTSCLRALALSSCVSEFLAARSNEPRIDLSRELRPHRIKAEMFGGDRCSLPGGSEYFMPDNNGWAANGRGNLQIIVCAGGNAGYETDRIQGRFMILRFGVPPRWKGIQTVDVPKAGPLEITRAPIGYNLPRRMASHARLRFSDKRGVTGTLNVGDGSVRVARREAVRPR